MWKASKIDHSFHFQSIIDLQVFLDCYIREVQQSTSKGRPVIQNALADSPFLGAKFLFKIQKAQTFHKKTLSVLQGQRHYVEFHS